MLTKISFRNIVFIVLCVVFTLYAIDVIDINPKLIPLLLIVSIYLLTCKNWNIFSKENRERFSDVKGTIIIPGNLKVKGNIEVDGDTEMKGNATVNKTLRVEGHDVNTEIFFCGGEATFKNPKTNKYTYIGYHIDGLNYLRGDIISESDLQTKTIKTNTLNVHDINHSGTANLAWGNLNKEWTFKDKINMKRGDTWNVVMNDVQNKNWINDLYDMGKKVVKYDDMFKIEGKHNNDTTPRFLFFNHNGVDNHKNNIPNNSGILQIRQ